MHSNHTFTSTNPLNSVTRTSTQSKKPWAHSHASPTLQSTEPEAHVRIVELYDVKDQTAQSKTAVGLEEPLFQATPTEVVFCDYDPFTTMCAQISFRNKDMVTRRIRLQLPDTRHFTIEPVDKAVASTERKSARPELEGSTKIAPGMEKSFSIVFRAEEVKDYRCDLLCITEREKFVIPVSAVGLRASLEHSHEVAFGTCAVNFPSVRPLFVRNVGLKATSFRVALDTASAFSAAPLEASLVPGESAQITVTCCSQALGSLRQPMTLLCDDGTKSTIYLTAEAQDTEVYLSTSQVSLPNTYLGLQSEAQFTLHNNSDVPVKFDWKGISSTQREDQYKQDLSSRLQQQELNELNELQLQYENTTGDADSSDEVQQKTKVRFQYESQQISKKFKLLRRQLAQDPLPFEHANFRIEPVSGELWPKGTMTFTVHFKPTLAQTYTCTAYCAVSGRSQRLPATLQALGIGPRASLSQDSFDVGDVFLNASLQYSVMIQNAGEIEARFKVAQHTSNKSEDSFVTVEPSEGCLAVSRIYGNNAAANGTSRSQLAGPSASPTAVAASESNALSSPVNSPASIGLAVPPKTPNGAESRRSLRSSLGRGGLRSSVSSASFGLRDGSKMELSLSLKATRLGDFKEVITFALEGSSEPIRLVFRGRVVPPTIVLDQTSMEFGRVSFSFKNKQRVHLTNASTVPVNLQFLVPELPDPDRAKPEFSVEPSKATVAPSESISLSVFLESETVCAYNTSLQVFLQGVAAPLKSLPLHAQCIVPEVVVDTLELPFDDCCRSHPYSKELLLSNFSDLPAKVEILVPDPEASDAPAIVPAAFVNVVAPNSTLAVPVSLTCPKLGRFAASFYAKTVGSSNPPVAVKVTGCGVGPSVTADCDALDFGTLPVLTPTDRVITLTNASPIAAAFTAFARTKNSVFKLSANQGTIEPQSSLALTVTACLDDNTALADDLHIAIADSAVITLPCRGRGSGSTIRCTDSMDVVSLGHRFTKATATTTFTLENHGRRAQLLTWACEEPFGAAQIAAALAASATIEAKEVKSPAPAAKRGAKTDSAAVSESIQPTFSVSPQKILLQPGTGMTFTVQANVATAGDVAENWICRSLPNGSNKPFVAFNSKLSATFINPLLELSENLVEFAHAFAPPVLPADGTAAFPEEAPITDVPTQVKQVTLTNVTALPLVFALACDAPFAVEQTDFALQSGESAVVVVLFDPAKAPSSQAVQSDKWRQSEVLRQDLIISYRDHAQKDKVALQAQLQWPNLTVSTSTVDFGCLNNCDLGKRIALTITNTSSLPVDYQWAFMESEASVGDKAGSGVATPVPDGRRSRSQMGSTLSLPDRGHRVGASLSGAASPRAPANAVASGTVTPSQAAAADKKDQDVPKPEAPKRTVQTQYGKPSNFPINSLFDILPIRGHLMPGETQEVVLAFTAQPQIKVTATAVCEVLGGPDYFVALKAETASMSFRLDANTLNFGALELGSEASKEIVIFNTGKVPFEYQLETPAVFPVPSADAETGTQSDEKAATSLCPSFHISTTSLTGRVGGHEKRSIPVKALALLPAGLSHTVQLKVGYLEAVPVTVNVEGVLPQLSCSLNREPNDAFQAALEEAKTLVAARKLAEEQRRSEYEFRAQTERDAAAEKQKQTAISTANNTVRSSGRASPAALTVGDSASNTPTARGTGNRSPTHRSGAPSGQIASIAPFVPAASVEFHAEMQADRLCYLDWAKQQLQREYASVSAATTAPPSSVDGGAVADATAAAVSAAPAMSLKRNSSQALVNALAAAREQRPVYNIATYVCDFGNVTLGSQRKRVIKLINEGTIPVSFELNKALMAKSPFAVEPNKVVRLPPNTPVELTVVFASPKRVERDTPYVLELPVIVKGASTFAGASITLKLSAQVIVPEIEIVNLAPNASVGALSIHSESGSTTSNSKAGAATAAPVKNLLVNFGSVKCGHRKEMIVQLKNPKVVPCEWSFKGIMPAPLKAVLRTAAKHDQDPLSFRCEPASGTLAPNQRVNVVISFTPDDKRSYSVLCPMQTSCNPKAQVITCKGLGVEPKLAVQPQKVNFGVLLPGQASAPMPITLRNEGDAPIEVYSLEFDQQYRKEEEMLAAIVANALNQTAGTAAPSRRKQDAVSASRSVAADAAVDTDVLAITPVREPGQPLDASIVRQYALLKAKEEHQAAAAASSEPSSEVNASAAVGVGSLVDSSAMEQVSRTKNVLVYGPPFAGATTLCRTMCDKLSIPQSCMTTLDEAVKYYVTKAKSWNPVAPSASVDASAVDADLPKRRALPACEETILNQLAQQLQAENASAETAMASSSVHVSAELASLMLACFICAQPAAASSAAVSAAVDGSESKMSSSATDDVSKSSVGGSFNYDSYAQSLLANGVSSKSIGSSSAPAKRFTAGVIIDGVACSYLPIDASATYKSAMQTGAAIVKSAFEIIAQERWRDVNDNNLCVAVLNAALADCERNVDQARAAWLRKAEEAKNALAAAKFKVLAEKDLAKLKADKRAAYDAQLAMQEQLLRDEQEADRLHSVERQRVQAFFTAAAASGGVFGVVQDSAFSAAIPAASPMAVRSPLAQAGAVESNTEIKTEDPIAVAAPPALDITADVSTPVDVVAVSSPVNSTPAPQWVRMAHFDVQINQADSAGTTSYDLDEVTAFASVPFAHVEVVPDPDWTIPAPRVVDVIRKPSKARPAAPPKPSPFVLVCEPAVAPAAAPIAVEPSTVPVVETKVPESKKASGKLSKDTAAAVASAAAVKEQAVAVSTAVPAATVAVSPVTRWVLAAHSEVTIFVQCLSASEGAFASKLGFEVVGHAQKEFHVPCEATVAVPQISNDARNVFMHRIKSRKAGANGAAAITRKQYILDDKQFAFGPLLIGKRVDLNLLQSGASAAAGSLERAAFDSLLKMNGETIRIANTGKFPAKVALSFQHNGMGLQQAAAANTESPADATAASAAMSTAAPVISGAPGSTSPVPSSGAKSPSPTPTGKPGSAAGAKKTDTVPAASKSRQSKRAEAETKEAEDAAAAAAAAALNDRAVFFVFPSSLDLAIDEVKDVTVWSFPTKEGVFAETLCCAIADNPAPVRFDLSCEGAKPALTASTTELLFDRLLNGQSARKEMVLKNTSPLPVQWTISGADALSSEFAITPASSGVLQPLSSVALTVQFTAKEPKEFNHQLSLEYRDTESVQDTASRIPLTLQAEAFKFDSTVSFGGANDLDFGVLRVGDSKTLNFTIENKGKYVSRYALNVAAKAQAWFKQAFTLSSTAGEVQPGSKQDITLILKSDTELHLTRCNDLTLQLVEAKSDAVIETLPIVISAKTVFSKFRVVPNRGTNFGPLELGSKRVKKIELFNDGVFEFAFKILTAAQSDALNGNAFAVAARPGSPSAEAVRMDSPSPTPNAKPGAKASLFAVAKDAGAVKKGAAAKAAEPVAPPEPASLKVGAFTVSPCTGTVAPGAAITVTVELAANTSETFLEMLHVHVANANIKGAAATAVAPAATASSSPRASIATKARPGSGDRPASASAAPPQLTAHGVLVYELTGEGCAPGLDTENVEDVFEEHTVVKRFTGSEARVPAYGMTAPLSPINDVASASRSPTAMLKHNSNADVALAGFRNVFASEDRMFHFAPVMIKGVESTSNAKNVQTDSHVRTARFRLHNPFKVPCDVKLAILPKDKPVATPMPATAAPANGKSSTKRSTLKGGIAAAAGGINAAVTDSDEVFTVTPSALHVGSHEYQYVTVTFAPKALRTYDAVFCATVDKAVPDSASSSLKFALRGEGTLPRVSVDSVNEIDSGTGAYVVAFPRVFCGPKQNMGIGSEMEPRHARMFMPALSPKDAANAFAAASGVVRSIVLRNNGIVTATARFDLQCTRKNTSATLAPPSAASSAMRPTVSSPCSGNAVDAFSFSALASLVTLEPGQSQTVFMKFHPTEAGSYECTLRVSVLHNTFETSTVVFKGESYVQDVTVSGAAAGSASILKTVSSGSDVDTSVVESQLQFGDISIGQAHTLNAVLTNHSDHVYRFQYDLSAVSAALQGAQVEVVPSVGHLPPHSSKTITVSFNAAKPVSVQLVPLVCAIRKIRYTDASQAAQPVDWDNSMRVQKWVPVKAVDAPAAASSKRKTATAPVSAVAADDTKAVGEMKQVSEVAAEPSFQEIVEPADPSAVPTSSGAKPAAAAAAKGAKNATGAAAATSTVPTSSSSQLVLLLSAAADKALYECKTSDVQFVPTMMFQTRVFKLNVKNSSGIELRYNWALGKKRFSPSAALLPLNGASTGAPRLTIDTGDQDSVLSSSFGPFAISPSCGAIAAKQEQQFTVRFAPSEAEVFSADAVCCMPQLDETTPPLRLALSGSGLRPKCHFELEPSNYLSAGRRKADMPGPNGVVGPLDPAYRVLEVSSMGVKLKNTKRFYVHNPTNMSYAFEWCSENEAGSEGASTVKCVIMKGLVAAGRKTEMVFEYTPQKESLVESFWRIVIKDHSTVNISVPFVIVGQVLEPCVTLDRPHVNFGAVRIGRNGSSHSDSQTMQLINAESVPFAYSVDLAALPADRVFDILPVSGTVPAEGSAPITITFKPCLDKSYNVTLPIIVKNKPGRLALNLKAQGYQVKAQMMVEEESTAAGALPSDRVSRELMCDGAVNRLNFGTVHVKDRKVKTVAIANQGDFACDFSWKVPKNDWITVSPIKGALQPGNVGKCELTFQTVKAGAMPAPITLLCTVGNSLVYSVQVEGSARKPAVEFSFVKQEFGSSFVLQEPVVPYESLVKQTLRITNKELDQNVSIDVLYDKHKSGNAGGIMRAQSASRLSANRATSASDAVTSRTTSDSSPAVDMYQVGSHWLDLQTSRVPTVLAPKETMDVTFVFVPTEARSYSDVVPFEINGLHTVNVSVSGEGVPLKLELHEPGDAAVDFGNIRTGHRAMRAVKLVNRSAKAVTFALLTRPDAAATVSTKNSAGAAALQRGGIDNCFVSCQPAHGELVTLKPRETCKVSLTFAPSDPLSRFEETVYLRVQGRSVAQPLLTVAGVAFGIGLKLDLTGNALNFGSVVHGSTAVKRIALENIGDIPMQFRFDLTKYAQAAALRQCLSLTPMEGVVQPHDTLQIEAVFHPTGMNPDMRFEKIPIVVTEAGASSSESKALAPIMLTVAGACVAAPAEEAELVKFVTKVRATVKQTVIIRNDSESRWVLKPAISHAFFEGAPVMEVPAKSQAEYTVTYAPLTMTKKTLPAVVEPVPAAATEKKDKPAAKAAFKAVAAAAASSTSRSSSPTPPAVLTAEELEGLHQATLFFPLPDGKASVYRLAGSAAAPEPEDTVECKTLAKRSTSQPLTVTNWLNTPQRFKAVIDVAPAAAGADAVDATVSVTGMDSVDVPGLAKRVYKLNFFAFKEGVTRAVVKFVNEESGEYLLYNVIFTATGTDVVEVPSVLKTPIREALFHPLTISNPLEAAVNITKFTVEPEHMARELSIQLPSVIARRAKSAVKVCYRPLQLVAAPSDSTDEQKHAADPAVQEVTVTMHSDLLGAFVYRMRVQAQPQPSIPTLRSVTTLGQSQSESFRFVSFCPEPQTFECTLNGRFFTLESKSVTVPACPVGSTQGIEGSVTVTFNPEEVGHTLAELVVSSPGVARGGEYRCTLQGVCELPKPVGPILVGKDARAVTFQNVLATGQEFFAAVDHPSFVLNKASVQVEGRSAGVITVSLSPSALAAGAKSSAATVGKLVITCPAFKGVTWVYYLQASP